MAVGMTTVDCPHREPAMRTCTGCPNYHPGGAQWCEGEIEGRVYRDSDGDPGVINGVRNFWAVEDENALCGCALTEAEWDKVREKLVEVGSEPVEFDDY
jgi:hypothetical protein